MQAARERSARGEFRAGYALLVARVDALRGIGAAAADARWGEGRLIASAAGWRVADPLTSHLHAMNLDQF
jgi:hypothetical protein